MWSSLLCLGLFVSTAYASDGVFERVHHTKDQALEKIFGKRLTVSEETVTLSDQEKLTIEQQLGWVLNTSSYTVLTVHDKDSKFLGYSMVLHELGKHQPITFLAAITPDFKVKDYLLLVYREHRGDEVKKKRFRKQFWGLGSKDSMQVDIDIDGITGATISSWSIASGVKKALLLVESYSQDLKKG